MKFYLLGLILGHLITLSCVYFYHNPQNTAIAIPVMLLSGIAILVGGMLLIDEWGK